MEGKPERRRNVTPKPEASQPPAQQQPPPAQRIGAQETEIIPATPSQCGNFIQYDVCGKMFEVTSKYRPPIRILGAGAYGAVCSAVNSETNEKVAIKKIENPFEDTVNAKRALREIRLLQLLNHENVVAIKDVIPPRQREAFNDVYIVFELMDFDLQRAIYKAKSLNETHRQSFKKTFPDVNPVAIDLVEKMLTFDPRQRITVEDALAHPYLSELHGVHDNPVCPDPISFDFEDLTVEDIKERIYQLALDMNPEFKQVVVEDPPSA